MRIRKGIIPMSLIFAIAFALGLFVFASLLTLGLKRFLFVQVERSFEFDENRRLLLAILEAGGNISSQFYRGFAERDASFSVAKFERFELNQDAIKNIFGSKCFILKNKTQELIKTCDDANYPISKAVIVKANGEIEELFLFIKR
jgi:hypothetical protein